MPTNKRLFGDRGEYLARMFLVKHGFRIITQNYLRRCGEIDIVAKSENDSVIHFIEVKSVSCETFGGELQTITGGSIKDIHRPEDNVDGRKIRKIIRTANLFLLENKLVDIKIQFDLITVKFRPDGGARIKYLPNINF